MASGQEFTVPAAKYLIEQFSSQDIEVLFDHGDPKSSDKVGKIVSWFGPEYKSPYKPLQLANLDIAVVSQESGLTLALIEIEDTTDGVKTLLGDVLGTLLGSGIALGTDRQLRVGSWTTLVVLGNAKSRQHQSQYQDRVAFLNEQSNQIRAHLSTPNASVGRVIVDTFVDQSELNAKLLSYCGEITGAS